MISQKHRALSHSGVRHRISERQLLIAIFVLAVLLRLGSAIYQGNQVSPLPGTYDQISYDSLAQRVVAGHGFSFAEGHWPATRAGEPTAHWSYLYTLYLTAVYAIFGYQPLLARIIQAVLVGLLQTWLTWRIARRIFGPRVGLTAAALSAVYIYFFYYAGSLLTESFYFVGILWTLDAAMRITADDRATDNRAQARSITWLWLELGLAVGLTVLLRQVFLLFVPVLLLWIWWTGWQTAVRRAGGTPIVHLRLIRGMAIAVLVVFLMIIPWTIRNYLAFDTFVPLNTNAGFAFFWGNHPVHRTTFIPLLGEQGYYDLIPVELRHLNEAELDRALLRRGIGFVTEQPARFLLLSLSRTEEYFKFWPTQQSGLTSNLARVFSFALTLPFMLHGLWLSAKLVREPENLDQRAEIVLLYLFVTVYTGLHLISWTLIRYRLPVDAILLIFAGLSIANLTDWFRHRKRVVNS